MERFFGDGNAVSSSVANLQAFLSENKGQAAAVLSSIPEGRKILAEAISALTKKGNVGLAKTISECHPDLNSAYGTAIVSYMSSNLNTFRSAGSQLSELFSASGLAKEIIQFPNGLATLESAITALCNCGYSNKAGDLSKLDPSLVPTYQKAVVDRMNFRIANESYNLDGLKEYLITNGWAAHVLSFKGGIDAIGNAITLFCSKGRLSDAEELSKLDAKLVPTYQKGMVDRINYRITNQSYDFENIQESLLTRGLAAKILLFEGGVAAISSAITLFCNKGRLNTAETLSELDSRLLPSYQKGVVDRINHRVTSESYDLDGIKELLLTKGWAAKVLPIEGGVAAINSAISLFCSKGWFNTPESLAALDPRLVNAFHKGMVDRVNYKNSTESFDKEGIKKILLTEGWAAKMVNFPGGVQAIEGAIRNLSSTHAQTAQKLKEIIQLASVPA